MADFVKLNGYDVKDLTARNDITSIQNTLYNIKRPEDFGCIGNGIVDDTENFKLCLEGGGYILGTPNKRYLISETLELEANTTIDLNSSTIIANNISRVFFNFTQDDTEVLLYNGKGNITIKNGIIQGGCISFIHGHDIIIDNIHFLNVNNDHIIEICACNNYKISNCIFEGVSNLYPSVREYINIDPCNFTAFPWLPDGSGTFDGTKNTNIFISNNVFKPSSNVNYAYMERAVGCHYYTGVKHDNIVIDNNIVLGNTDTLYSFSITDMSNVMLSNNLMYSRWGIQLTGSDYVDIVGNKSHCNDAYPRTFIVPDDTNISTHISIEANTLINRNSGVIGSFSGSNVTFDILQPMVLFFGDSSSITTSIPVTSFNKMVLQMGAVGGGNLSTAIIRSFHSRGFQVGESYPLNIKGGYAVLTIAGEKQITIAAGTSGVANNCRQLIAEKNTEFIIG